MLLVLDVPSQNIQQNIFNLFFPKKHAKIGQIEVYPTPELK